MKQKKQENRRNKEKPGEIQLLTEVNHEKP